MRNLKYLGICALLALAGGTIYGPLQAQTSNPADIKATADAIQALQDQEAAISANQDKIDAKLADITENVRVARLYSSRAR
jgi:hypothetical protein